MAAASPVLINSSSPQSFPSPLITPPSPPRSSDKPVSSSPGLLSPSAFIRPRAPGLRSGSRAQQIPAGVRAGFASAWESHSLDDGTRSKGDGVEDVVDTGECQVAKDVERTSKKATGKLVKLKASSRACNIPSRKSHVKDLDVNKLVHDDALPIGALSVNEFARPDMYEFAAGHREPASTPPRKTSINLVRDAIGERNEETAITRPWKCEEPEKKRWKKATKDTDATGEVIVKKPRKRKPKSEALIINSDEPEQDIASVHFAASPAKHDPSLMDEPMARERPNVDEGKAKRLRAKKTTATDMGTVDSVEIPISEERNKQVLDDAVEKSTYFAKPCATMPEPTTETTGRDSGIVQNTTHDGENTSVSEIASRRRRSWTPVMDTSIVGWSPTTGSGADEHAPKLQLGDVLGSFGYVSNNATLSTSFERAATGESATKRRRIELADAPAVGISTLNAPESAPLKQPKPKKKAQTITALATAAFQPPQGPQPEQSNVSEYFAPRKNEAAAAARDLENQAPKPKEPRKPRDGKSTAEGKPAGALKPKKAPNTKKSKPKIDEANFLPKLYSPKRAFAQFKQQDFLFGTSSQLAVDEAPAFIKDMQLAIQESDMPLGSQAAVSPQWKSYVKVPTAPHGTCLSVEQTDRELWCAAARDGNGGVIRQQRIIFRDARSIMEQHLAADNDSRNVAAVEVVRAHNDPKAGRSVVDLCQTSPLVPVQDTETFPRKPEQPAEEPVAVSRDGSVGHVAIPNWHADKAEEEDNDGWTLLKSEDSVLPISPRQVNEQIEVSEISRIVANGPLPLPSSYAGIASPLTVRSVLQPLDANTSILAHGPGKKDSTLSHRRAFNSTIASQARAKAGTVRPRGQAHNDTETDNTVLSPPKRRGRPPRQLVCASEPSPCGPKLKKAKTMVSTSQPVGPQSEWLHIDEISDSDSPVTPSPPRRRRATSSPLALQPLRLSPAGSAAPRNAPVKTSTSTAVVSPAPKPGDQQWPTIRSALFPQITSAIKTAPRSTDPNKPSWWEKILLYDPIVLEDITAWLNGQGLRVSVRQRKAKEATLKKRGRKRKADIDHETGMDDDGAQWEVSEEEIKAWMVQKWCEEMSICCLWKEGLRGRVKTGY